MKELSDKSKPQSLEELFRTRLEAAEATPSERVWERIEQGLDLKEAGYYKERVNWYRSLAAACIVMVMCAAMYLYYDVNSRQNADQNVATLPQNQRIPNNIQNKSYSSNAETKPLNKKYSQPTEEIAARSKSGLPAPTGLATTKPGSVNNGENAIAANVARSGVKDKIRSNKPDAVAGAGSKKINPNNLFKADNKRMYNTAGIPNELAGAGPVSAGEIALTGTTKPKIMVTDKVLASDVEPLMPVNAWAGLGKVAPTADSLWKPKAIEATPPALAWEPNTAPEPEKPKMSRWSFSARYAPQYFNQNIELASAAAPQYLMAPNAGNFNSAPAAAINTAGYTEALNEYDRNTSSGFSYNTAAAVGYTLNEHWSVETGLLFTQNVAISKSSFVFSNSYLATRYSNADPGAQLNDTKNMAQAAALPTTALVASLAGQQHLVSAAVIQTPAFETEYRYRSLGVPLKLNYQTKSRKSFYFASIGLLTNLLVQANIISESNRVPDMKFGNNADSPFRPWQFATVLSAGKGFRVSEAISLRAGLEGTQYLTSLAAHPENLNSKQRKPYSIGVAFSSSYTLGR